MLPPMAERDPLEPRRGDGDAALHPAAAALFRGQPGEEDGGTRHRPALHLCLDPVGAAGPQIRPAGEAALHSGGPRPAGDRVPGQLLRALRRYRLHRRDGGEARRHRRRQCRMAGDAAHVLGRVLARGRPDQGPQDQRRDRGAGSGPRAALLPAARGRHRPARLPGLRQRPAGPEARALRQLHRLLELSGLPVHAAPGDRERRGSGRDAEGGHARPRPASRTPARTSPSAAARTACMCSRARTARTRSRSRAAPRCRAAWTATRSRWSRRSACCRCRATIGMHPETHETIQAGIGRFGPYVRMGAIYRLARSRRRRAGDRHQPRGGPDRAQDGERAHARRRIRRTRN